MLLSFLRGQQVVESERQTLHIIEWDLFDIAGPLGIYLAIARFVVWIGMLDQETLATVIIY